MPSLLLRRLQCRRHRHRTDRAIHRTGVNTAGFALNPLESLGFDLLTALFVAFHGEPPNVCYMKG